MGCRSSQPMVRKTSAQVIPIQVQPSRNSLKEDGEPSGSPNVHESPPVAVTPVETAPTPTPAPAAPLTAEERRAMMAAAAEKRGQQEASASNLSSEADRKMRERRQKDELIGTGILIEEYSRSHIMSSFCAGKITEQCKRLGKDVPFGLATASPEALKKHLDLLRNSTTK